MDIDYLPEHVQNHIMKLYPDEGSRTRRRANSIHRRKFIEGFLFAKHDEIIGKGVMEEVWNENHEIVNSDTDVLGKAVMNKPNFIKAITELQRNNSIRNLPKGVKLCECPSCGESIQYGLSAEVRVLFNNMQLFKRKGLNE